MLFLFINIKVKDLVILQWGWIDTPLSPLCQLILWTQYHYKKEHTVGNASILNWTECINSVVQTELCRAGITHSRSHQFITDLDQNQITLSLWSYTAPYHRPFCAICFLKILFYLKIINVEKLINDRFGLPLHLFLWQCRLVRGWCCWNFWFLSLVRIKKWERKNDKNYH